jgi:ABC-type antimicrobial peptide transport system permease subunit
MRIASFFAGCAVLTAAIGLFGVMSDAVRRRTQEIGVRVVFGARPTDVSQLVLAEGLILTATGLAVGLGAGLALGRTVQSLLFGVSATDPTVLIASSVLLLTVAALACVMPTRRAIRLDPIAALRDE